MDSHPTLQAAPVDPAGYFEHGEGTWYRREPPRDVAPAPDAGLRDIGPMLLIRDDASGEARLPRACGSHDRFLVQICLSGETTGHCAGRPFTLHEGDIVVIDGARPFHHGTAGARTLTLAVERQAMARMLDTRLVHGHVLRRNDPLCQLLSHFICALYRVAPQLDAARVERVVKSAGDMLAACLRPSRNTAVAAVPMVADGRMPVFAAVAGGAGRAWSPAGERQRPHAARKAKARLPETFRLPRLPLPVMRHAVAAD